MSSGNTWENIKGTRTIFLRVWLAVIVIVTAMAPVCAGQFSLTPHGDQTTGVYRLTSLPRGNCAQCHSTHSPAGQGHDYGLFTGNYGAQKNQLCFTCHASASAKGTYPGEAVYAGSMHNTDFNSYWPGPTPPAQSSSDSGSCVNCHEPHGQSDESGLIPAMAVSREESLCVTCHDSNGPAMKNLGSQLSKLYTHGVSNSAMAGRHTEGEQIVSSNYSGAKRHVECADCHNPHKLPSGTTHSVGTNVASDVLKGVSRVEAQYTGAAWMPPVFTPRPANYSTDIRYEYELCFKCHSSWAYGSAPPTAPSGGIQTDQSVEFNPNNRSYHPVVAEVKNLYTSPSSANGFIETMEPPWDNGRHDLMYCSDCHRSEISSDPNGPHGSSNPYMLLSPARQTDDAFCLKCHKASVYAPATNPGSTTETGSRFDTQTTNSSSASHYNHVTSRRVDCRDCHGGAESGSGIMKPGSVHGTNRSPGLLTGAKIESYTPGSCDPTCHGVKNYTAGS